MQSKTKAAGDHKSSASRKTLQSKVVARSSNAFFGSDAKKSPAGLEFKLNLVSKLFGGAAECKQFSSRCLFSHVKAWR